MTIIKTKIIFEDNDKKEKMGLSMDEHEDFEFDLKQVDAIMPVPDKDEQSIVFLNGIDVRIEYPFPKLQKAWHQVKNIPNE